MWRDALILAVGARLGRGGVRAVVRSRQSGLPQAARAVMRELTAQRFEPMAWTPRLRLLLVGWVAALGLVAAAAVTL